jgi:hypothetical protein
VVPLADVIGGIPDFPGWSHADKVRLFAWYLHFHASADRFKPISIKKCYEQLNMEPPSNVGPFLTAMLKMTPAQALHDTRGYYLEYSLCKKMSETYGHRKISIQVAQMLLLLPSQVPDVAERDFLDEALICYQNGAFRATIIMVWNLAFDHLLNFILRHHLASFNRQWPISFLKQNQKARLQTILSRDDFGELKESEVLTICKSATIISPGVYDILDEKLGRRNNAAHPSTIVIGQLQAEDFIDDLVKNVVVKLIV